MKSKILGALVALFSVFSLFTPASAGSHEMIKVGDVVIEQPWARASASKKAGAAFFKLNNKGGADKLLAAKSDVAKKVEIHLSSMDDNGVMKMEKQDYIELPANGNVVLKPGSYHVMLMKLNRQMEEGDKIDVELVFEKAGSVMLQIPVMKAGAMGHNHSH